MNLSVAERCRILVVEDEHVVAMDIEQSLVSLGYEVTGVAESGHHAIRLAQESAPDLVLMDIRLKGQMDGVTAAEEIRQRWQIPVVFVTANANEETLTRAKVAGAYGFIIKPFHTKELNATIEVALQQHRLTREMFAEHAWLSTLLGSLSDAVMATDAEGHVRYLNPAAEAMTGWSFPEAAGEPIEELYSMTTLADDRAGLCPLRKAIANMAPTGKQRYLLTGRRRRGTPVEGTAAPILDRGLLLGAVAVFRDIAETLHRERQEEEERDRLEEEVQSASHALGQTRAELRALSGHLMTAQEEERRRIARELHDDFGQRIAIIEMCSERLAQLPGKLDNTAQQEVDMIRKQIRALDSGLHEVSHRLHPSVLADIGLPAALGTLIEDFRMAGGEASLRVPDRSGILSIDMATALYRIAQEALRNVAKHAPGAPVRIVLSETDSEIQLTVEDAGPGFDLGQVRLRGGLGLLSMQERARLAGGTLEVRTGPGEGALLTVRVPAPAGG